MVKGRRESVNSLTALMDGLNVKEEQSNDDSVDSLLGKIKDLKVTTGKTGFKKPRKSKISVSSKTGRVKMDISNTGKAKKKVKLPRRTLSSRNADETLSNALGKLGLGTKKKRKRRRSKSKKKKRRKRRSKTKRN